jgi:hypothetical protein
MIDIVLYYVLPNVLFFGSLVIVAKYVESATQDYINNYELYQKKISDLRKKIYI